MTKYKCWIEEYGQTQDYGLIVNTPYGREYADAACLFLEQYENLRGDYPIAKHEASVVVNVKQDGLPEIANVKVMREMKLSYFASDLRFIK